VTTIGQRAFAVCDNLTAAIFSGNAPSMGMNVFEYAPAGFRVYYPTGATGYDVEPWTGFARQDYSISEGPAWSDTDESILYPDWYASPWYGWFYRTADFGGWVYSSAQGWQYMWDGSTTDSVYLYDNATASWWWTCADFWPLFFNYADASWYIYQDGTVTPARSFFSYKTSGVVGESALP